MIHQSSLGEENLAELWDAALTATLPPTVSRPEYRQGYLDKVEFFVLLSELQVTLAVSIDSFHARLGQETASPPEDGGHAPIEVKRSNPFTAKLESPAPITAPWPLIFDDLTPRAEVVNTEEIREDFGKSAPLVTIDQLEPKTVSMNVNLPTPVVSTESDKIALVGPYFPILTRDVPDTEAPIPFSTLSSDKELVTNMQQHTLAVLSDQKLDTREPEAPIPLSTHSQELEAQISQSAEENSGDSTHGFSHHRTSSPSAQIDTVPGAGTHELESLLSTKESDRLAVERLEALKNKEEEQKRDAKGGRRSIAAVGKSLHYIRIKKDPDKSASGYSLEILAEALERAASEGNVALTASLLALGAHAVYASIKNQKEHSALRMAAMKGHIRVVDLLVPLGSTQCQIDRAFLHACYSGHVDLAIKLVQEYRANIYPQADAHPPLEWDPKLYYSPSCFFAMVCYIADRTARMKLLDFLMSQKQFEINKIVLSIYRVSTNRRHDLTALALFVNWRWVEGVSKLLDAGAHVHGQSTENIPITHPSINIPSTSTEGERQLSSLQGYTISAHAICCISAQAWQKGQEEALKICRLLIKHGSNINLSHEWTSDKTQTCPLATAVAGGSCEGADLLLAYGADPESKGSYKGEQYTVLGLATRIGSISIARLLVKAGAPAWKIAHKGRAPLYIACEEGHIDLVDYLLDAGGKLNDKEGLECLDVALKGMRLPVVELLMQKGAKPNYSSIETVMGFKRNIQRQPEYLKMLDLLLSLHPYISPRAIIKAIDNDNDIGLTRVLSSEKGSLGSTKSEMVYLSNADSEITCLSYADYLGKRDLFRLLESYGFTIGRKYGLPVQIDRFQSQVDRVQLEDLLPSWSRHRSAS